MYVDYLEKSKEEILMGKLKIGVIGAGSISEAHLGAYVNNEKVELYAICDLNEQRAKDKAEKYGAKKVYVDYNDLMNDPEVDAVSICTWNNTHAEIATAAVNSGKHVLVEKPMTTS